MDSYDFNLRDLLRLRLVGATDKEANMVQRQLGPIAAPFSGPPDLVIRFVDRIPETSDLHYIGLDDAAFNSETFFVLKGKNKTRVKVAIPFDQIGQEQVEVCCERGVSYIPLLIPLINLILLTKGVLPFHASAFNYQGRGILVTGWSKGGKTETLLSFMSKGARYVGDEWVYLCSDGSGMFGIPEPIRVWSWHLDSLPHYRERLKRKDKVRLQSLSAMNQAVQWAAGPNGNDGQPLKKIAQRVAPLVQRQLFVHFPPHALFGSDQVQEMSAVDQLIFTASHNRPEITVEPMDAEEITRRMIFSLREEQAGLISYYTKFRFAFPDRANPWLDNLERVQAKLLKKALNGKDALALYHPYPVEIPRLFEAVEPYLSA